MDQWSLLGLRRFLPLFITQFLGAFNDNVFKNALVILITYRFAKEFNLNAELLITIAAGIFILPFFLFSAPAGQLADKYEKSHLIRYTKMIEVLLMVIAAAGFYYHKVYFLMIVLFLLGAQATFFGPLKYSILPDHLKENELIAGNALIESGTFLAILLGTILGGILVLFDTGIFWVCVVTLTIAMAGLFSSYFIPKAGPADPQLSLRANIFSETWRIVSYSTKNREVFRAIVAISWFWLMGATYLSQFPSYGKDILGAESSVVTLFLTLFSVGVGVGSLLCNQLLKGEIHTRFVPYAAFGMSLFGIDLVWASQHGVSSQGLMTFREFLSYAPNWRIVFDLLLLSICGGIYTVPLYAVIQQKSAPEHRSRVIASNNVLNALFMVVISLATSILLAQHFTVSQIFLIVAVLNIGMVFYTKRGG